MYSNQSQEVKQGIVQRYTNGESVATIARETQIAQQLCMQILLQQHETGKALTYKLPFRKRTTKVNC